MGVRTRTRRRLLAGLAAVVSLAVAVPVTTALLDGDDDELVLTLRPVADAYANEGAPDRTFGGSSSLVSRGAPGSVALLRFAVPAAPAGSALSAVTLRIRTTTERTSGSAAAHVVRLAEDSWDERALTWRNRPALGATLGRVTAGTQPDTLYSSALDPAAAQAVVGRNATLAVTSTSPDSLGFWSRDYERVDARPELTVTFRPRGADAAVPSPPGGLTATAGRDRVQVTWTASTDDVGVRDYELHRATDAGFRPDRSTLVATLVGTSYVDRPPRAGTFHYVVVARDAAGNSSAPSGQAAAGYFAPADQTIVTLAPVADSFANEGAARTPLGSASTLTSRGKVGAVALLRFRLPQPPDGRQLTSAALRVTTTSEATAGSREAHAVRLAGGGWEERSVTWRTRPRQGQTLGAVAVGTQPSTGYEVRLRAEDLRVRSGRELNLALSSVGRDSLSIWSREQPVTSRRPALVLSYTRTTPDRTPPAAPARAVARSAGSQIALDWDPSTDTAGPGGTSGVSGVVGYEVHRSDRNIFNVGTASIVTTTTSSAFTDRPPFAGTWYYYVLAVDDAGNRSLPSPGASAPSQLTSDTLCGFTPTGPPGSERPRVTKTMVVWFGARAASEVYASRNAPYLNDLSGQCGVASDFSSAGRRGLPNRLLAHTGVDHDRAPWRAGCAPAACGTTAPSLLGQLGPRRWKAYVQGMGEPCLATDRNRYRAATNTPVYLRDAAAVCGRADVPLGTPDEGALRDDLDSGDLPDVTIVVPLPEQDMSRSVGSGDAWLAEWIPLVTRSADYREGRLAVLLAWDASSQAPQAGPGGRTPVPFVVLSGSTPPGTVSTVPYDHASLLRLLQELADVPTTGAARGATSMRREFGL